MNADSLTEAVNAVDLPGLIADHYPDSGARAKTAGAFKATWRGENKPSGSVFKNEHDVWMYKDHGGADAGTAYDFLVNVCGMSRAEAAEELKRLAGSAQEPVKSRIVETYDYVDADGTPLFQTVRFEPKDFRQRQRKGNRWEWNLKGVTTVLYNLPNVIAAVKESVTVHIVEGEKDVLTLEALGKVATCNPMGAGKWREHYGEVLQGAHAVILPDNDQAGTDHARTVALFLEGKVATLRIVKLPGLEPKGDVTDWTTQGKTADDLDAVVSKAEVWTPNDKRNCVSFVKSVLGELSEKNSPQDVGKVEKEPRRSQASELGDLVQASGADLFRNADAETFITVSINGHFETYRLKSSAARAWLRRLYREQAGKSIGGQALQDALNDLEGIALFDDKVHEVHVRLAEYQDDIILDLGDETHRVVRITPNGFHLEAYSPVKFVRPKALAALPVPVAGGSMSALWELLNVTEEDRSLICAWLVAALRPTGPYPILALHGEQGSAKSTTARAVRALVDPSSAPLRSEPRDARDLMIAATSSWVPTFDNLSSISPALSDALCILSTGGGYATRTLYANDEETILKAQRPVIMTAISDIATRPDLLDRCIILYLPRIKDESRKPESAFWEAFNAAHGRILGALLTAMSAGLAGLAQVQLSKLPRMADFAIWAVACEQALGLKQGSFLNRYSANRADANELALDTSPLPAVLKAFVEAEGGNWEGVASDLLTALGEHLESKRDERTPKQREWPKRADKLSNTLRRFAPNLRATGLEVDFKRSNGQRMVVLRKVVNPSDPSDPSDPLGGKVRDRRINSSDANRVARFDSDASSDPLRFSDPVGDPLKSASGTAKKPNSDASDASDARKPLNSKKVERDY